ncbi:MAG: hypothetical protein CME60_00025 [Halobacteriovoraceae bacterium]|nr:hypothetical protein [Halobacteriovoraceae bacterium]
MRKNTILKILSTMSLLTVLPTVYGSDFSKEDILFSRQWGLKNTGQSLFRSTGELTQQEVVGTPSVDIQYLNPTAVAKIDEDREVVVAVLDTGLDIHHPDLKGRIFVDKKLCPTEEDLDTKPCSGINILKGSANLTDDDGHGTHVAGIIAANTNSLGIAGVTNPQVKILPVKVLNEEINHFVYNRKLVTDWFADGIAYSMARGADVINMSIGWPALIHTPKMKNVLKAAADKNIPIVVAAGNNNKEIPTYPCTEENVICVGAYDNQGKISEFSNFGGKVDISAPGESIVSLYPMDSAESRVLRIKGYEVKNGTSQAAPFVAAIAASLKLAYPEITYDELRARLYSSTLKETDSEEKFTQFGRVNMKKALMEKPEVFLSAEFKNLLDVTFSIKDGSFSFPLEIKSYMGDASDVLVQVEMNNEEIEILKKEYVMDLYGGFNQKILIEGKIKDFYLDTNQILKVTLKKGDKTFVNRTKIVFSRNLSHENLKTEKVIDTHFNDLLYFRGSNKTSRIKRVKTDYGQSPEYFTLKAKSQGESKTVVTLLKRTKDSNWITQDLDTKKFSSIIRIFKNDFNHDGHQDYLIYGILAGENKLGYAYHFQDKKLNFEFDILSLEGFPLEADDLSSVQFVNTQYNGASLKVPAFYAQYRLPEEDNTDDLLERIDEKAVGSHLYYLNPVENAFYLRVINTPAVLDQLKEKLDIAPWEDLSFEKPFNTTSVRQQSGYLEGLLSSGEEFSKSYFRYQIVNTDSSLSVEPLFINEPSYISQNSSLPVWSMEKVGEVSEQTNFVVQPTREKARSYILKEGFSSLSPSQSTIEFDTHNYRDPIFGIIGSFDDEQNSHLLEGRYYVHYQNHSGQESKLRINRESSFPGVQFAETLSPVIVRDNGQKRAGAFINSTLIFGSRLYTMVANEEGKLTRPVQLSVDIPDQCVHLNPEAIEGEYNYLLLCRERDNSVVFKRLPLVLGDSQ